MPKKINKNKRTYLILFIIDIALISFIFITIYNHLNINKRKNDSYISTYQETSNVTYNVNLLENSYLNSETFGKSNSYILKYTDNILFNFFYTYTSSQSLDTYAHYEIIADITGSYKKSTSDVHEIYHKKIVLDNGDVQSTTNTIYLEKSTKVNIKEYNDILKDLQEDIKLPLVGQLTIYLNVDTKDKEGNIIDNYQQPATIGLLSEVFDIETTKKEPRVRNFYSDDLKINYTYLISLAVTLIIFITIAFFLVKQILSKKMTKGEIEANKILKTYDDFIVNINDVIDEENYQVIMINEFKELLTLANNNATSILYFDKLNKGIFYCILNNYLYKFEIEYR